METIPETKHTTRHTKILEIRHTKESTTRPTTEATTESTFILITRPINESSTGSEKY